MFEICLIIVLLLSSTVILGVFLQKDFFNKILFLNSATSIISLFICFLGSYKSNSSYIDIALIYFLLSVIATMAYMKYFIKKSEQIEERDSE